MKIYDSVIEKTLSLLGKASREFPYLAGETPEEGSRNELVLQRDAAYELGGGSLASINYTAVTNRADLVPQDEICVYGPDISEIKSDCGFARIALLRTEDVDSLGEQANYEIIKNIENKKYMVSPRGYMLRASALSNREQVRVAKYAVKQGLSFEQVGSLFIKKYHEDKRVLAAKIIFVTLESAPFPQLDRLATTTGEITSALNHLISDLKMDCHSCEWKPVCDEVEGLKELHSKLSKK